MTGIPFDAGARFVINGKLGSGSFGIVYDAVDRYRNRPVALKVLERAAPETVMRFKREFRYLAELRHPNLASMYEMLVLDEKWVLSMELVRGSELLEYLAFTELQNSFHATKEMPAPVPAALSPAYVENVRETFRQLAVAVAVLHARDIIHRDIKPSNIMITAEGRVVLLDFGLIVEVELDDTMDRRKVIGTPGYMSPEQMIAETPSTASDWYSVGVLLYQALTGQMPHLAQTAMEMMEKMLKETVVPASEIVAGVPRDLSDLASSLLLRAPEARPGDLEILQRLGVTVFDPIRGVRMRDRSVDLLGRAEEMTALFEDATTLEVGKPRLVLLPGAPGVGKTALIDVLLNRVRSETDSMILGGRCHAWDSVPFNAVDSLVDSLARLIRRERPEAVDEVMSRAVAVTRLFPALVYDAAFAPGEETIVVPVSGEKLSRRAAGELASILFATAGGRPVVMMLDDAQWGDYQSALFLQRIFTAATSQRLVLICAYREEDWKTSLLLQILAGGSPAPIMRRIDELSPDETVRLVNRLVPGVAEEGARRIATESGGNPELTAMIAAAPGHTLGDAIRVRLERLSAPARRIIGLLLSSHGPLPEMEIEERLELIETDEPLRTLSRERLIRVRRTGDLHEVDLYHPRMRDVLRGR
jgi:eukaryotic-like serine/threonine-protein kinase